MRPRVHNVLSYSVGAVVFAAVFGLRTLHRPSNLDASLALSLWTLHFVRRSLEAGFVHRYSKPSIGPADYVSEYVYYWGFAAWIAWSVTSPEHTSPPLWVRVLGLAVFAAAELGNARAHVLLRELRTPNGTERRIPRGLLFQAVSCPHYFCEIMSWLGFNLVTGTLAGLSFMLVGAGILGAWALSRHRAYLREFDGREGRELYPPSRRALLPFLF